MGDLFAADGDAGTAGLVLLTGIIGGAVTWVVTKLWDWRNQRRKESLEDAADLAAREKALLERVDRERVELREECRKLEKHFDDVTDELRERLRAAELKGERAVAWIKHLEARLDEAGIKYRRWEDAGNGSSPHVALPPEGHPQ